MLAENLFGHKREFTEFLFRFTELLRSTRGFGKNCSIWFSFKKNPEDQNVVVLRFYSQTEKLTKKLKVVFPSIQRTIVLILSKEPWKVTFERKGYFESLISQSEQKTKYFKTAFFWNLSNLFLRNVWARNIFSFTHHIRVLNLLAFWRYANFIGILHQYVMCSYSGQR